MNQQRRKVQRAFTGLVGLPPEPDEKSVVSPPMSEPAPQTEALAAVLTAPTTCEYHRTGDQWICFYCSHHASEDDMTAAGIPATRACPKKIINQGNAKMLDKKFAERERRAAAARARRKQKTDQLVAIKERLRTPIAVVIAEAKEQQKQERQTDSTGHIHNKKYLTGGGAIDDVLRKHDAAQLDFGGKRVTPQGVGHRPGMRSDTDSSTPDEESTRDPWTKGSEEIAVSSPRTPIIDGDIFKVRLNDKDKKNSPAYQSVSDYFVEMETFQYVIDHLNPSFLNFNPKNK